jgi:hypothetical protein
MANKCGPLSYAVSHDMVRPRPYVKTGTAADGRQGAATRLTKAVGVTLCVTLSCESQDII